MKRTLSPIVFVAALVLMVAFGVVRAQDGPLPENVNARPMADAPPGERPNLLRELGLSQDQVREIRRLNQQRKPQMNAAAQRLRMANRALDEAIYTDTVSEEDFQSRLREFQAAQAEIARIRFESELNVRRILTPEQLSRFRELRRRFAEQQLGPGRPGGEPNRRQLRRLGRPPIQDRPF
jgi:Spy/CpxP family protein refolding chaperone